MVNSGVFILANINNCRVRVLLLGVFLLVLIVC